MRAKLSRLLQLLFVLGLVIGLAACDESDSKSNENQNDTDSENTPNGNQDTNPDTNPDINNEDFDLKKSSIAHNQSPAPTQENLAQLTSDNAAFAFDLYGQLSEENDGNLFYSPFSLSMALAMSYGGAKNVTAQQMADVLHFSLGQDELHEALNKISLELESREQPAGDRAENGFDLVLANSFWGQKDFPIVPSYLDLLSENYDAGLRTVDFQSDFEKSIGTINDWIAGKTENKIVDMIDPASITPPIFTVLVNAIYFKAPWNLPFEAKNTTQKEFTLLSGETTMVDMMTQGEHFAYGEGDGYQAVSLPYDGEQLDMVLIAPDAGTFAAFEASLNADKIESILDEMSHPSQTWATLNVPKFHLSSDLELVETFKAMGLEAPFDDTADFSGMSENFVRIQKIFHQTDITVDEAGTEAAAATVVVDSNGDAQYVDMNLDRPFIFLIRDVPTGTILFVGRVTNPSL